MTQTLSPSWWVFFIQLNFLFRWDCGRVVGLLLIFGGSSVRKWQHKRSAHMTKDERIEKESELYRLYEGANPFETEVELKDRIAELEADLDVLFRYRDSAVRS